MMLVMMLLLECARRVFAGLWCSFGAYRASSIDSPGHQLGKGYWDGQYCVDSPCDMTYQLCFCMLMQLESRKHAMWTGL